MPKSKNVTPTQSSVDIDAEFLLHLEAATGGPPQFIDDNFAAQAEFIRNPARRKFAFCTRRAGKSEGAGRYLFKEAFEHPNTQVLYVGLTRGSAKAIMWTPILKRLANTWGLNVKWNEVDLTATLSNGSIIRLTGADANDGERQKLLGQRNRLVVLDECASFRPHIRELVLDVLRPTLIDELGTMVAIGTPGEVAAGWFYDVTTGKERGWLKHRWTTANNPYMAKNFAIEIADLKSTDPDIELKPWFRRQYLGEWVTDTHNLVYQFDPNKNTATKLDPARWVYGLGIDLGWNDDTAFVVVAWCDTDESLYIVDTFKSPNMTFNDVDKKIRELQDEHGVFSHIIIDNANRQGVEDMRTRFGWNFIAAQKQAKFDAIGMINTDLRHGIVKLLPDAEPLVQEWQNLVWQKERTPPVEDPTCANHLSDAALYIHRYSRHYLAKKPDIAPKEESARNQWEIERQQEQEFDQWENQTTQEWWERE